MMNRVIAALVAVGMLTVPAFAAAPSAEQRAEFYKTCMGIAQNDALCSCKADAALKLVDSDFMAMVIASMKGKAPPAEQNVPYNDYIAKSNQICKPGY
ncbi:MAG TPA: hypothetical protein VGE65_01920 [Sphingobium sp.]